jgi:D-alanyl-D-alanine carboxypeptidase
MSSLTNPYRLCAITFAGFAALGLSACTLLPGWASDPESISKRFKSQLESLRTSEGFPGATAAFILPDDTTRSVAVGLADLENEVPMTADMLQPIGRGEESFVSAIALSLEIEDTIDLDERVYTYFDTEHHDAWILELPNAKRLTLRHLLTHSSGLVDKSSEDEVRLSAKTDESPIIESNWKAGDLQFAVGSESEFEPGRGFNPVEANYRFAKMVLEQTTKLTYTQLLQDRILDTRQLNDTTPLSRSNSLNLPSGYHNTEGDATGAATIHAEAKLQRVLPEPSANDPLYSNPKDLLRWAKLLFEENALDEPYMESLFASGYRGSDRDSEFGLGVYIYETTAGEAYGYSGTTTGHETAIIYFPRYRVGVCIQVNRDHDNDIRRYVEKLAQVVLNAIAD